ncbi:glycosyltransferase [archaeon]|jgi:radical SAM protein with 4Fe4S-binding SPASM domain|nr:glycosyltransferase [archaeon]MBT4373122.1 glycosyltransferase [archaeon]MBT4531467.1 glycosyltransferase [archaeon]MBT7282159.1 glycosyltransferase [archaeon]
MKNKNQPLVSVIINTRNSAGKIFEKCLASVKVQSYKNVELIVVDNSSSDKTKEIAKRYTKKVFDYGPERSSQKNFGVQKSRGEFLVFLDDDQEMPPEIIEDCVKKIKDKDVLLIEDKGLGTTFWTRAHAFEKAIHFNDQNVTAPRFMRKKVFLEIGGFDESLVLAEDLDLFMRLKEKGVKVGHLEKLFNHYEGGSLSEALKKSFYYGTTASSFLKKNPTKSMKIYFLYHPFVYLKNWKLFLRHPIYGGASIIRKILTYIAGGLGLISNSIKNNSKINLAKTLLGKSPSYVIFYVTSRCNSRCKYCFFWKELNQKRNELSLNEITKITKSFDNLLYVSLTGGEPFLREDIDKIAELFYKKSGTRFLAIPTNGLLSEKIGEKVESILNLCPGINLRIELSIDALGEKHDEIRGVMGNFKKMMQTFKILKNIKKKNKNLKIIIHSVYSAYNEDHIKKLFDYIQDKGIDQYRAGIVRTDSRLKEAMNLDKKKYLEFLKYLDKNKIKSKGFYSKIFREINKLNREINFKTRQKQKMVLPCVAGQKMLVIGEEGDVYPCEMLSKKMGNLRNYSLNIKKLLKNKEAIQTRQFIVKSKCFCDWGCATQNNILFNFKTYPKLLLGLLK